MVAYFPASGYRYYASGTAYRIGIVGDCWASSVFGLGIINGSYCYSTSLDLGPCIGGYRSYALSVRCVQELAILYKESTILARSIVE